MARSEADRATDIAEAVAVIRDLLESRGLLDARLEVYAALEGASEDDAESWGQDGIMRVGVVGSDSIPERTLRLTSALTWRILEREAGR